MYHGQLQEMKSGTVLYRKLIPEGLITQESVHLINYLSRLIYGENVYEVYVNNPNQSDYVSEMKEYITHNTSVSTHGRNNRFNLIEGITNTSNQIDQEELNKHRNEDFPLVVHNFEEIDYVFKPEKACSSTRALNISSKYIDNLMNEHGDIDYVFKPEKACSGTGARDIESRYVKDFINDHSDVDLDLLDQHRNSKYPTCVHNFEEIDCVPIYIS